MTVQMKFRNEIDFLEISGDLLTLTNELNIAAANGKQFALLQEEGGGTVAVDLRNINFMRETDSGNAFVS